MLVLTRREGERIIIDGHMTIVVIQIAGGRVRLGIDAPKEIRILRSELLERPAPPRTNKPAV